MEAGRRYEFIAEIGQGGFGSVYQARLLGEGGFSKLVAVKLLRADMAGTEEFARRLRDEARMLGLLRHRAIVGVDGLVSLEGRWALVMEYVEGEDLAGLSEGRPLPVRAAVEMALEVAGVLHAAWTTAGPDGRPLQLLHRDIKPPNIRITRSGAVKVLDFGIARADFDAREAQTRQVAFGSPGYMAPERFGMVEAPAGDVYSLGVVLWEALSGEAFGQTHIALLKHEAHVGGRLDALAKRLPPEAGPVLDLLGSMLLYEPESRPAARDVERRCDALRGAVPGQGLRDWAEATVPEQSGAVEPGGELAGRVVSEADTFGFQVTGAGAPGVTPRPSARQPTIASTPPDGVRPTDEPASSGNRALWLAVAVVLLLGAGVAGVLVLASAGGAFLAFRSEGGPVLEEGQESLTHVPVRGPPADPELVSALEQPFYDLVMTPNAERSERTELREPANWDRVFFDRTAAYASELGRWRAFYRRLDQAWEDYAAVVLAMRAAGLPELMAGIPYVESRYEPELQSTWCAKGAWQFMPESAHRIGLEARGSGLEFRVAECAFAGEPGRTWSPTLLAPPAAGKHEYVKDGECRIPPRRGCKVDDRTDVSRATAAAVHYLRQPWDDPEIAGSGAAVQMTVLSFNAGYDDARFDVSKPGNVLPAYRRWKESKDDEVLPRFYGENLTCDSPSADGTCGSVLHAGPQHYAYRVVGVHILAMCYYGAAYGDEEAFRPWRKYQDGYCGKFAVPDRSEVAGLR